ncbi:MAG: tetratricopeptide repeat protein [Bacteroidota bacterium]
MQKAFLFIAVGVPLTLFSQKGKAEIDSLVKEKKYEQAESALQELLHLSPNFDVKDQLGKVYGLQRKWDDAIAIYKELTSDYPKNASYAFRYGGVLAKKAQSASTFTSLTLVGRIKESFKRAVALDPGSIEAHWALVDLYVSLPGIVGGSTSKALDYAKDLKAISAIDGYLATGYVYEYDDDPGRARENYFKAMTLLNDLDSVERNQLNYQIGKVCGDYGLELGKGLEHMQNYIDNYTALDGVPLKWAYLRMAKLYRKKEDKSNAKKWLTKALAIDPEFTYALSEKEKIDLMGNPGGL